MDNRFPYEECEKCKDLGDCKHPDVALDCMGTVLPPDCCPHPILTMKQSLKKRKLKKKQNGLQQSISEGD
jgi:hypothetical protein